VAILSGVHGQKPAKPRLDHAARITTAAFSPDSEYFVIGLADGHAYIREVQTGKSIGRPLRHQGAVLSARLSPNNVWIVTGSADKMARVWRVPTGGLSSWVELDDAVVSSMFREDGRGIIGVTRKGTSFSTDDGLGLLRRYMSFFHSTYPQKVRTPAQPADHTAQP